MNSQKKSGSITYMEDIASSIEASLRSSENPFHPDNPERSVIKVNNKGREKGWEKNGHSLRYYWGLGIGPTRGILFCLTLQEFLPLFVLSINSF